jgi:hypothetical protein
MDSEMEKKYYQALKDIEDIKGSKLLVKCFKYISLMQQFVHSDEVNIIVCSVSQGI